MSEIIPEPARPGAQGRQSQAEPSAVDATVRSDDARPAGKPDRCFYCGSLIGGSHRSDCVIMKFRRFEAFPPGVWQPIESYIDGFHALFYWPRGERGNGGVETAMLFRQGDDWNYWTHGGPNSGMDWEPRYDERPSHWMPLPDPPSACEAATTLS